MISNSVVSEFLRILFDKKWHALYEMHAHFKLNAAEIHDTLILLQKLNLIERREMDVRILENLDEQKLSIINRLMKRNRPEKLDLIPQNLLTKRKKRVSSFGRLEH